MSENPNAAGVIAAMERLWNESFVFARRLLERHAGQGKGEGYWDSLPAIADAVYHNCQQATNFLTGSSQSDIEARAAIERAVLAEVAALNRKAAADGR